MTVRSPRPHVDLEARARRRTLLVALVPLLACLAVPGVLLLLWWPRLPDRMASHFSITGVPDQVGQAAAQVTGFYGALAAVAVVGTLVLVSSRRGPRPAALVAGLVAVEVVLSSVFALVLHAHLDLTDPYAARLPVPLAAVAVALGLLAGWLAARLCPEGPGSTSPDDGAAAWSPRAASSPRAGAAASRACASSADAAPAGRALPATARRVALGRRPGCGAGSAARTPRSAGPRRARRPRARAAPG